MGKSRAEYMRDYRQKKREEKLKTEKVKPKNIARNSTQRSRDFRARAANAILSQKSIAEPKTVLPNLVASSTSQLPSLLFSPNPSTSTATACTGSQTPPRPADVEPERVKREVAKMAHLFMTLLLNLAPNNLSEET